MNPLSAVLWFLAEHMAITTTLGIMACVGLFTLALALADVVTDDGR